MTHHFFKKTESVIVSDNKGLLFTILLLSKRIIIASTIPEFHNSYAIVTSLWYHLQNYYIPYICGVNLPVSMTSRLHSRPPLL